MMITNLTILLMGEKKTNDEFLQEEENDLFHPVMSLVILLKIIRILPPYSMPKKLQKKSLQQNYIIDH